MHNNNIHNKIVKSDYEYEKWNIYMKNNSHTSYKRFLTWEWI